MVKFAGLMQTYSEGKKAFHLQGLGILKEDFFTGCSPYGFTFSLPKALAFSWSFDLDFSLACSFSFLQAVWMWYTMDLATGE